MSTLLELSVETIELLGELDALEDGELTPELAERLTHLAAASNQKIDNTLLLCRELELRAAAQTEEAERLAKRAQSARNKVAWLRLRIKEHLELTGQKTVETPHFRVTVAVAGGKPKLTLLVPVEELPEGFRKEVVKVEANTDNIRVALAMGMENADQYARLEPRTTYLRIT